MRRIGDEGLVPFCEGCDMPYFPISYPCVICLVVRNGKVALIKEKKAEGLTLVAGYVRAGERAEEAARREVGEELGIEAEKPRFIKSYYYQEGDNLMLGFVCAAYRGEFALSEEVEEAGWFSFEEAKRLLEGTKVARFLLEDYLKGENY